MLFRSLWCVPAIFAFALSNPLHAANSYYEQAVQAFYEGKYESSFIYLKNALDSQPRNLPAKILMGKILLQRGYFDDAITQFEEALVYKADINLIISDYATALNFAKRYKEVLAFADGYNLNKDSQLELYINKGIAYKNLELTELSKKSYKSAIALAPYDTRAINSLALLEMSLNNIDEAQKLVAQSLAVNPNDHRTLHLQGQIRTTLEDYDGAIESYLNGLQILDDDPVVRRSLISVYIKSGQLEAARALIDKVLAVTPEDPHIMLLSSWMLSIEKQDDESAAMLESLSNTTSLIPEDEFSNNPSLIFVTAISSYLQGNIEQATKELSKYLNAVPGDLRAVSMLTNVYMTQGKAREATYLLERHEAAVVNNLKLAVRLADLYLSGGQKFEAEMLLEKLEVVYPSELDVTLRLVSLYNQSGRTAQAKNLIEKMSNDSADIRLDIARGLMFLQNGSIKQAHEIAEILAAKFPESLEMMNFKSAVLIKMNRPQEAQDIIVKLLDSRPDFFEAKFNLATTHKMLGNLDKALALLEELHEERSTHRDVKFMLAQVYAIGNNFDGAIPLLESVQAKQTGKMSQELLYEIYYKQKDYQNAYRVIKTLSESYLYNPVYLFQEVDVLHQLNRFDEAEKQLGVLFGLAEDDGRMLFDVAVWQRKIKRFSAAAQTLKKLSTLLPNNLRVNIEVIRLQLAQGKMDDAEKAAIKLDSEIQNEPNILLLLGDIAIAKNDKVKAQEYYYRALEIDPKFNLALMNLYQIAKLGHAQDAFEQKAQQLIANNPTEIWRIRLLADHYMNTKQFTLAEPLYNQLASEHGYDNDPFMFNNMALISLESGTEDALDKALIDIRKAYDLNDSNSSIRDTLGWVYYQLARYDEALELLRSAHAMDSSNATIRYHLASVLHKLGRKIEAKSELSVALKNSNNEPWLEAAKALNNEL